MYHELLDRSTPFAVTRTYRLGHREKSAAATRHRILEAATELMTLAGFHPVAIDEIATQAGTTRPTVYRHFGSKVGLFEAVAWNVLATAGIERLDEARQLEDPLEALRKFLTANTRMFAEMGAALSTALDVSRSEPEIARVLELTYFGRRIESIEHIAGRLVDAGRIRSGWTKNQIVDALVIFTNVETFESLNRHRSRSSDEIAELLIALSTSFLDIPPGDASEYGNRGRVPD